MAYLIKADRGETAAVVGLAISAYAVGSLAGTLLAGRFGNRPAEAPVLAGSAMGGAALVALAWMGALPLVIGGSAAFGLAEGFILVIYLTARAHAIPDELLGRVTSTAMTVSNGMGMVGVMAVGVMLDHVGGVMTLTVMGATTLAMSALFGMTRALRGLSAGE
jgi:MFS family permease